MKKTNSFTKIKEEMVSNAVREKFKNYNLGSNEKTLEYIFNTLTEDRKKHSLGVMKKALEIYGCLKTKGIQLDEKMLERITRYHDIGYCNNTYHHNIVGHEILHLIELEKEAEVILRHSCGYIFTEDYKETKLDSSLQIYLDILDISDACINNIGDKVSFEERYKDIRERYHKDSMEHKATFIQEKHVRELLEKY